METDRIKKKKKKEKRGKKVKVNLFSSDIYITWDTLGHI